MDIIQNNPYRTVGLLVGATAREQERQIRRLKQFIEAEQDTQEDFSFPALGHLHRTIPDVNDAISKLNLDRDKINAALFWFYDGKTDEKTDEKTFQAIKDADLDQVLNIWTKRTSNGEVTQRNASAYSNLGTIYLSGILEGTTTNEALLEQGISLKLKFLESDFIKDFKALATDETFKTTKKELQLLFLNQVQAELEKSDSITSTQLLEILTKQEFSAKEDFLKGFVQKAIEKIERKIEEAKKKSKENKSKAGEYGNELYNSTKDALIQIKSLLQVSDIKTISISDKLANEVLQCGITVFNHFYETDNEVGETTLELNKKARSIALGKIVVDRIAESTTIIEQYVNSKYEREIQRKVGKEIQYIINEINLAGHVLNNNGCYPKGYHDPYSTLPFHLQSQNKVKEAIPGMDRSDFSSSIALWVEGHNFKIPEENINLFRISRDIVNHCKPSLHKIISALGESNDVYKKLSNDVASLSLNCLIKFVNNTIDPFPSLSPFQKFRPTVNDHVMKVLLAISEIPMEHELKKRYDEQKTSLFNLYQSVQGKRYPLSKAPSTSSSSSTIGSGCYIATMAYGDYDHPQVLILRQFRDNVLNKFAFGKCFIKIYYHYSPKLVEKLKNKKTANNIIRKALNQFIKLIK